jgi:hypothetical protein
MRVGAVISDLMLFSRIQSAASAAGATLLRVDAPADLPPDLDLILVDWSARQPDWTDALRARTASRLVLFGPHTDLEAHAAARAAGLGPMWARSKLVADLASVMSPGAESRDLPKGP